MIEAMEHYRHHIRDYNEKKTQSPDYNAEVIYFTDGSAIACLSSWRGPYSEVTPDIDAEPPIWWIGRHEN